VSGHSSSPLSSKCSSRSCLPSFSQISISSCSSLAIVLASCRSLCLCLVSSSNLNFALCCFTKLFPGHKEGYVPLLFPSPKFDVLSCLHKRGLSASSTSVFTTRVVRLDARPGTISWICIDVRILFLPYTFKLLTARLR
jgi:hypothetical protein